MEKSYYAIIPASVRYDTNLSPNSKLLYGEITALCNERGYCWANNAYFSNLYGVSNRAITNWINQLKKQGHIVINHDRADVEGYSKRYIMISDTNLLSKGRKKSSITP